MKKLGLIVNCQRPRAGEVLHRIEQLARTLGLTLYTTADVTPHLKQVKEVTLKVMLNRVDAIVALGGDGTVLRAARSLDGRDTPMIGVNIGSLGFLTSVSEDELELAFQSLASDDYLVSIRSVADCRVLRNGRMVGQYRALNDIVVHTGPSQRVLNLDVSINQEAVTSFICDGLILSTPTGSTGHGLSAGGPILTPDAAVFVMSLICPHTLSSRPLVIQDQSEIIVRLAKCDPGPVVTVDGQVGMTLQKGDVLSVTRSPRSVRFIHLPGYSYFAVLRQKLRWMGSSL